MERRHNPQDPLNDAPTCGDCQIKEMADRMHGGAENPGLSEKPVQQESAGAEDLGQAVQTCAVKHDGARSEVDARHDDIDAQWQFRFVVLSLYILLPYALNRALFR